MGVVKIKKYFNKLLRGHGCEYADRILRVRYTFCVFYFSKGNSARGSHS